MVSGVFKNTDRNAVLSLHALTEESNSLASPSKVNREVSQRSVKRDDLDLGV